jgi:branched-chain amino acid transport system permease protein
MFISIIDTILQGVLLGGLYALFATGLSLTFGIMRMVNLAHGDFIVLAAYCALAAVRISGMEPLWMMLAVVPLLALSGYVLQRALFNPTLGKDIMPPLLVSFGLSVIVQNGLLEVFSADSQRLQAEDLVTASIRITDDLSIGWFPVLVLCISIATIVSLQWMLGHTALGRAFRATSDDQEIVRLMGIDNRHIYALAMAIALAVVGISGILLGIGTTFDPALGPSRLLFAFETVIIGGMGSMWGTLAGGMILGVTQTIGFRIDPGWGGLLGHGAFLAVLLFRPSGLFPKTRER